MMSWMVNRRYSSVTASPTAWPSPSVAHVTLLTSPPATVIRYFWSMLAQKHRISSVYA